MSTDTHPLAAWWAAFARPAHVILTPPKGAPYDDSHDIEETA